LGVFGSWGSGKTSLMKMLKAVWCRRAEEEDQNPVVQRLAVRGQGRGPVCLIHAVLAKLAEDKGLLQRAKETFDRLKKGASVMKLAKVVGSRS